jgi:hypothetical protein
MKRQLFAATLASLLIGGFAASGPAFAAETVGEKVDDAALLAKIKTNLLRSPEVEGLDVNVDVKNGVVSLSGTAANVAERTSAERIAKTSDGVTKVDNRIVIKANSAADQPTPAPVPPVTAPPPPAN